MDDIKIEPLDGTASNVIYITEEQRVEWDHDATKQLLKLYDDKCDMLESGIITTQKKLWELLSEDMLKNGFYYTGVQCENRWKTLKRSFRKMLSKIDKYGTCRKHPFENEVKEILNKRPQESMYNRSFSYASKYARVKREDTSYEIKSEINLNEPSGFSATTSSSRKRKSIQNVDATDEEMLDDVDYIVQENGISQIVEEIVALREATNQHNRANLEMMRQSNELQSKMVQYLDGAAQRGCQQLELEETRMEQQNEIIKQMKIQNSLLQKLLDKLV